MAYYMPLHNAAKQIDYVLMLSSGYKKQHNFAAFVSLIAKLLFSGHHGDMSFGMSGPASGRYQCQ
jgi:hypothetical protein